MVMLVGVLGALFALGVVTFAVALRPVAPSEIPQRSGPAVGARTRFENLVLRVALGVGTAVVVGIVTRWPMAAVLLGTGRFLAPSLLGGEAQRKAKLDRVEAVASWAEMLRDTMAGSGGLEQSIIATAGIVAAADPSRGRAACRPARARASGPGAAGLRRRARRPVGRPGGRGADPGGGQEPQAPRRPARAAWRARPATTSTCACGSRPDGHARARRSRSSPIFTTLFAAFLMLFNREYLDALRLVRWARACWRSSACASAAPSGGLPRSFKIEAEERFLRTDGAGVVIIALLLGAFVGLGAVVSWRLLFPSPPPLQAAIDRLNRRNELVGITNRDRGDERRQRPAGPNDRRLARPFHAQPGASARLARGRPAARRPLARGAHGAEGAAGACSDWRCRRCSGSCGRSPVSASPSRSPPVGASCSASSSSSSPTSEPAQRGRRPPQGVQAGAGLVPRPGRHLAGRWRRRRERPARRCRRRPWMGLRPAAQCAGRHRAHRRDAVGSARPTGRRGRRRPSSSNCRPACRSPAPRARACASRWRSRPPRCAITPWPRPRPRPNPTTEKMALPVVLLFLGFLILVGYPAVDLDHHRPLTARQHEGDASMLGPIAPAHVDPVAPAAAPARGRPRHDHGGDDRHRHPGVRRPDRRRIDRRCHWSTRETRSATTSTVRLP